MAAAKRLPKKNPAEAAITSTLPYRKGVGMMLLNARNEVFVAKRIDMTSEAWQMPQGGIDAGEDPHTACMRELLEEIGTDKATIIAESNGWLSYDLPDHLVTILWKGRFRGQEQKWFALRFDGTDADINIETDHAEFSEWKWVPMHTLPDVIVPFKRGLYERIVKEFERFA